MRIENKGHVHLIMSKVIHKKNGQASGLMTDIATV